MGVEKDGGDNVKINLDGNKLARLTIATRWGDLERGKTMEKVKIMECPVCGQGIRDAVEARSIGFVYGRALAELIKRTEMLGEQLGERGENADIALEEQYRRNLETIFTLALHLA